MRGLTAMFSTLNKSAKSEQHTEKKTTTKGEESSNDSSSSSSRGKKKEKKKKRRMMRSAKGHEREGDEEDGGEKYVHCAVLGDGMVGKTCLTLSYTQRLFTDRYTATVFDNYPVPVSVGEEDFTISVFDTAGQKDYESLRAYTYQCSEVLVLCFSLVDRESFYNVLNCWLPEVQRHTKGKTPLLLVGTQIDLRRNGASTTPSSSFCGDMGTLCGDMGTLCGDMGTLCEDLATPSSSSWDLRTLSSPPGTPGSSSLGQRACSRDLHTPLSSSCWDMGSVSPSSRLSPCSSDHEIIPPTPSTLRTTASSSSSSSSSSVSASRVEESSRFPSSNTSSSSSPRGAFAFPSKHARNSISTVSSSSFSSPSSSFSSADVAVRPFSTYSSCSTSSTASSAYDVPPQEQEAEEEVSWEEGSQLARMIGADCYIECSARSQEGVEQVFQHVVFSALKYRKRRGSLLGRLLSKEGRRVKPLALSDKALRRAASTLNIPMVV